ncbi:unnamed protein product [Closterium sp. NIES-54]
MVGSVRYISNISRAPATYVPFANNEQLCSNAQGIMALQARDSNTHITFNDALYMPDLCFNLLSGGQLRDCGVMLTTDPYTRDLILTYAPPDTPVESHKYLGRARLLNGAYVLDFDIPNCQASSDELVDLVPLNFSYISVESWQHPDSRPWICRSPHPEEINWHQPGPDSIYTTCFTPTASRTEEVEKDLAAIQEAESAETEPTVMTEMELAVTTHRVFGIRNERLGLTKQQWKDLDEPEELSIHEEEEKARVEKKAKLYEERIAAGWDEESARSGGWGGDDDGTGATWGSATGASGTVQGWGDAERQEIAEGDLTQEEMEALEREMVAERPPPQVLVPLGRPTRNLPSPPHSPYRWSDPSSEIEEGSVPTTPPQDSLGPISPPDPFARFIEGMRSPLNIIPDHNFLVLYLTTAPAKGETKAEAEAEEPDNEVEPGEEKGPVLRIPHETEPEALEYQARYMRTSGIRADEDLWHQRLGHPSRHTFNNCLRTKVFLLRALLRPDSTEPLSTSHPTTCTICPAAALTHQAYPSLESSTNRYKKLQKVYSDFIVLTFDGINGERYTLTFVDAYSCHEFRSNELESVVALKGIKHQISLPYAHQQQGVAERVNRTLMTKVRALMNQSGLSKKYWPYAMNHAVCLHNLLSTTANRGNLSPDFGASHCFFHDHTTLSPLPAPVSVALADPTSGPVTARYTTTLLCPAVPSGFLAGFHVPSFSRNLVGVRPLVDIHVGVWIEPSGDTATCVDSDTYAPLASFHDELGSGLYTLHTGPRERQQQQWQLQLLPPTPLTAPHQVPASHQVAASYLRAL